MFYDYERCFYSPCADLTYSYGSNSSQTRGLLKSSDAPIPQETITITDLQREVVQAAPVPVHVELDVVTVLLSPDTGDVFRLVFR